MSKSKDFDNTVLAMSEWLDERMDAYLMLLTKDGASGMIMNGESDDVIDALASGMVDHEELRAIVLKAVGVAMHEIEEQHHCGDDVDDINRFNMN
jgi:hypothetical protein